MLKVEIKTETILNEDGTKRDKEYIIVNGIEVRDCIFYSDVSYVWLFHNEAFDILNNCSFQEVSKFIKCYRFDSHIDFGHPCTLMLDVICGEYYDSKYPCIKIELLLHSQLNDAQF